VEKTKKIEVRGCWPSQVKPTYLVHFERVHAGWPLFFKKLLMGQTT
jgi:hypothetical protein